MRCHEAAPAPHAESYSGSLGGSPGYEAYSIASPSDVMSFGAVDMLCASYVAGPTLRRYSGSFSKMRDTGCMPRDKAAVPAGTVCAHKGAYRNLVGGMCLCVPHDSSQERRAAVC